MGQGWCTAKICALGSNAGEFGNIRKGRIWEILLVIFFKYCVLSIYVKVCGDCLF
jgi:hypothetical protein